MIHSAYTIALLPAICLGIAAGPLRAAEAPPRQEAVPVFENLPGDDPEQARTAAIRRVQDLLAQVPFAATVDHAIRIQLDAERRIRDLLAERSDDRLQRLHRSVRAAILAHPPPQTVVAPGNNEMRLITAEGTAVYIRSAPVTAAEIRAFRLDRGDNSEFHAPLPEPAAVAAVSYLEAKAFATWLSAKTECPYRLPTAAEAAALGQDLLWALWTESVWNGPTHRAFTARTRYGITMQQVHDPGRLLGEQPETGELPFAVHPNLGFTIVTEPAVGVQVRLQRIERDMRME